MKDEWISYHATRLNLIQSIESHLAIYISSQCL
jgi:hypothetical protein